MYGAAGRRVWWWALSPPIAFYGTVNFDLLAVAFAVGGLAAYRRRQYRLAGLLCALGTLTKVYPAVYLILFAADRCAAQDRVGTRRLASAFLVTIAAVNVPLM
jgi:uncharacterized membrane protein